MASKEHDFSVGSIPRNIISLALPMTAAQLINVLYSVVDRIYLGRLPGHLALTGLGLTLPIISIVMGFANLCGTGGAPLCSIYRGKGEEEEAERIMGNAFTLLLIFGAAVTGVFLLFRHPLLYLFGASDATYPYAEAYMTIYLLGTVFVMIGLGMNPFITSQGFGRTGMMTVGLGAVVNIVLDPVFIFALDMGVRGAALGTIMARLFECAAVLVYMYRIERTVCFTPKWLLRFRSGLFSDYVRNSVPVVSNELLWALGVAVTNLTIGHMGPSFTSAVSIVNVVNNLVSVFIFGMANATAVVVGKTIGEGRLADARRAANSTVVVSVVLSLVGTALLLAGGFAVAGAAVSLARIRLPLPEGLKRIKNEK